MFNLCLMMDCNARLAACNVFKKEGISPKEFLKNQSKFIHSYEEEITATYAQNALWSAKLGREFFKRNPESDYVVFIYNYENRRRKYWDLIRKAVEKVGDKVIKSLSEYAGVYTFGVDKFFWKKRFPDLKFLKKPREREARAIFGFCFEQQKAYDESVKFIKPIDYFIRVSQMRLSGMYLPALSNARFILLTHPPVFYNPKTLVKEISKLHSSDVEHDDFNIYRDERVYEEWRKYVKTPPKAVMSSLAHPPKLVTF